jgi:hypothetical protein
MSDVAASLTMPQTPYPSAAPELSFEPVTAWHPMLVALLENYLQSGYKLVPELLLTRLPQRIDIVVIRKTEEPAGEPLKIRTILGYLGLHTLIEHKGPTDTLAAEDALVLLGYAMQYMRLSKLKEPADVRLMVVADRISEAFVKQIQRHGGSFARFDVGLWRGEVAGFTIHGVEAGDAYKHGRADGLLYAFSKAHLEKMDMHVLRGLDDEELAVYRNLYQQVEQFRRLRGEHAMKDLEELRRAGAKFRAELTEEALANATPEQLLARLTPEQRLARLTPEQRLADLTPEQRLADLTPEQIADLIARLPPEVRETVKKQIS